MTKDKIFVFGSNLAGIHGAGAALFARNKRGALIGIGVGIQGNSYAIPTKDENIKTLPFVRIKPYIDDFITYAKNNPQKEFYVSAIGCGLAGYSYGQIAPFFKDVPFNVELCIEFQAVLSETIYNFMG